MRGWLGSILLVSIASAQVPNVAIRLDLFPSYLSEEGGKNRLRWYDQMARASTVGLGFNLEPGYYVLVTERLQRITGDKDREQLDELYVEDPGVWRVGRQYMPFGAQNLVRQSSIAIRTSQLPFLQKRVPIQLAYVNDGGKLARGVVGRLGSRHVGVSLAWGDHFLLSSTNLAHLGDFENRPAGRKGYRLMGGLDLTRTWGRAAVAVELVALRRGESDFDPSKDLSDVSLTTRASEDSKFTTGWTRDYRTGRDFYRFETELQTTRNVALRSFVRFERGTWKDLAVGVRIRF